MNLFVYVLIFLIGASLGSFFELVSERLPREQDVVFTPSHCDSCQMRICYYDLIPIFGYINQRGRCRFCDQTISAQSLVYEMIGGFSSCWFYYYFTDFSIYDGLLLTMFYYAAIFDQQHHYVDQIILTLMFVCTISFQYASLRAAFIPALLAALVLIILSKITNGLGPADIELIIILILGYGFQTALWITLLASLFVLLSHLHHAINIEIAFIPYFYLAFLLLPVLPTS